MPNGIVVSVILSVIGGLLALVNLLFGLVLKSHKDSDDERWKGVTGEIDSLRKRLHDFSGQVGKVDQWQRFYDADNTVIQKIITLDKALSDLTLVLHKDFVTKEEWERVRTRLHEIADTISGLKAEADMRKIRR